jgi:glycerophosphoryl diester phosphodiesterase
MRRLITATAVLTGLLTANANASEPRLEARAILPADATFAAPFSGVINTDPVFAPNSSQPVRGFSALLDAGGGELWAMPDNGFGNKANSRSLALRLYKVKPRWDKATVQVKEAITRSDPENVTATPGRFDSTMIVAITSPHPHSQPMCGPNALTVHVKDVPASGIRWLRPRYA